DPQKALANAVVEVVPSGEREEVRALPVRGQASGNLETLIPGSGATAAPSDRSRSTAAARHSTPTSSAASTISIPSAAPKPPERGPPSRLRLYCCPLDSIQEIRVETDTGAEYGPSGAAVLTVIKKGGSQIHGSLFEFFDNDKLAANNFYNNAFDRP